MQRFVILSLFSTLFLLTCARDKFEEIPFACPDDVTYDNTIKEILVRTCGYPGDNCHDGNDGVRSDYNNYLGVKNDIDRPGDRGFFNVIIGESTASPMPPTYTTIGPKELTAEEFELIKCWMANDYKEN